MPARAKPPAATERLAWEATFLEALAEMGMVSRAAQAAGVRSGTIYARRNRSPQFARAWDAALKEKHPGKTVRRTLRNSEHSPAPIQWKRTFLDALAETSNVTASAAQANISTREVYRERRDDADFATRWRAALYEGYVNLEMELLGYLRDPDPAHKMDVANALRLLAAHKETAAQEQAVRANVSAAEVRASIARKVDALRQQVQAERAVREKPSDG